MALATELDPQADALAIYPPGSKGRHGHPRGRRARLAPGRRLRDLPSLAVEGDVARFYEDGFAVMLSEPSRKALHEALRTGRDLELLGAPGSMAIRVRWRD